VNDGYVKILDFGLAKLLPQPSVDSEAVTITKEGTAAGTVTGTASYLSPEQALGRTLDARTDSPTTLPTDSRWLSREQGEDAKAEK
jgi:serine/threonine-protein kinase